MYQRSLQSKIKFYYCKIVNFETLHFFEMIFLFKILCIVWILKFIYPTFLFFSFKVFIEK